MLYGHHLIAVNTVVPWTSLIALSIKSKVQRFMHVLLFLILAIFFRATCATEKLIELSWKILLGLIVMHD